MPRTGDGIALRGTTYWLDFRFQGHRHIVRLGSRISRHVAREIAAVHRTRIAQGAVGIGPKVKHDLSFPAAKEEFLKWATANKRPRTTRFYTACLGFLSRSFNGKPLSQICRLDVERHKQGRIQAGAFVRANREVQVLKNLFNRVIEWDLFSGSNPAIGVKAKKEPQQRLRYLEHDEEKRLLDHSAEPLRSLLCLCIHTGLRVESEALTLRWTDVDLKRKLVTVSAAFAKSVKTRTVPLNSRAYDALRYLQTTAKGECVFAKPKGQPFEGFLDKPFARALRLSGLTGTGITPHVCRHTFASRLVAAGIDLRTVQDLGGWSDLSLVQRYAHLAPGRKAQAVEHIVAAFNNAMPKDERQGLRTIA